MQDPQRDAQARTRLSHGQTLHVKHRRLRAVALGTWAARAWRPSVCHVVGRADKWRQADSCQRIACSGRWSHRPFADDNKAKCPVVYTSSPCSSCAGRRTTSHHCSPLLWRSSMLSSSGLPLTSTRSSALLRFRIHVETERKSSDARVAMPEKRFQARQHSTCAFATRAQTLRAAACGGEGKFNCAGTQLVSRRTGEFGCARLRRHAFTLGPDAG